MTIKPMRLPLWGSLGLCCAALTLGCAQTPNTPPVPMPATPSAASVSPVVTPMPAAPAAPSAAPVVPAAEPALTRPNLSPSVALDTAPVHFEQAWDVAEVMGKPVAAGARVVFRGQGGLLVDGGCNQFSGRVERNDQGQLRVSKYSGSHRECDDPARSEALLNSALVMTTHYQQQGKTLELRNGDGITLVRLVPSANQEVQSLEQAVARAAPAPAHGSKSGKGAKGGKSAAHGKGKSSAKSGAAGKAGSSAGKSSGKPTKAKKKTS